MTLAEIREIVRTIRNYELTDNYPIDLESLQTADTKFAEFYQVLLDNSINSDEAAAFRIYGNAHPGSKYKFLKSHFLSRSLSNISYLDLAKAGISEQTQAIYKAYKNLFYITVLVRLGNQAGAFQLMKKTLVISEKYELHHVIIELLEQFRNHDLQQGNRKEYIKHSIGLKHQIMRLENESKIKTLENEIRIHFTKSLFIDDKVKTKAKDALNKIEKLLNKDYTYNGWIFYFRLKYIYYQIIGLPNKSIEACEEAIKYMSKMKHMTPASRFGEFALYKFENYILLQDYKNGVIASATCLHLTKEGSNLWFKFKENEFLFMMQTLKFHEAVLIIKEVTVHERFFFQLQHLRERWEIFEQYAYFASGISGKSTPLKMRKVSVYSKDKKGFNVAILLMNILYLLGEKKMDLLFEQVETLSSYRFHYLSGKYSRQSFLLFKLIHIMINNEFDLTKINKKAIHLEAQLQQSAPATGELFECIQILPPDWIWSKMKKLLSVKP